MELKLKNGSVLSGTLEEISSVLNSLGEEAMERLLPMGPYGNSDYYRSESKGLLPIKGMNILHIRNAACKIYREWVGKLNTLEPEDFLTTMKEDIHDETFLALLTELRHLVEGPRHEELEEKLPPLTGHPYGPLIRSVPVKTYGRDPRTGRWTKRS